MIVEFYAATGGNAGFCCTHNKPGAVGRLSPLLVRSVRQILQFLCVDWLIAFCAVRCGAVDHMQQVVRSNSFSTLPHCITGAMLLDFMTWSFIFCWGFKSERCSIYLFYFIYLFIYFWRGRNNFFFRKKSWLWRKITCAFLHFRDWWELKRLWNMTSQQQHLWGTRADFVSRPDQVSASLFCVTFCFRSPNTHKFFWCVFWASAFNGYP